MIRKLLLILALTSVLSLLLSPRAGMPVRAFAPEPPSSPVVSKGKAEKEPLSLNQLHSEDVLSFAPSSTLSVDPFGYTLDDTVALTWRDVTTDGTSAGLSGDDDYTELIDIGFDFKFYEHTYDQLSISTNGFVTFEGGSSYYANQPFPADTPPNNIIAPFWDDLYLISGSSTVHYKYYTDSAQPCGTPSFVVEWNQIESFDNPGVYTFELLLCQSGDIVFQYADLSGELESATVGIEDRDGINGLTYLSNAPGLSSDKAIRFERPGPAPRVKLSPVYQSGFAINQQCQFEVTVQNIGEAGADTFDLSTLSVNAGWTVSFKAADGNTPLVDSNQDGKVDTGVVGQGASTKIILDVQPPAGAVETDYTQISLVATSSSQNTVSASASFQAAIPAPFAQLYSDYYNQDEVKYNQTWKIGSQTTTVDQYYTGTTLALAGTGKGNYVVTWEKEGETNEYYKYSNVEYRVLNRFGQPITPVIAITDNQNLVGPNLTVKARNPSVEVAPDGRIALAWIQYKRDTSNIFEPKENTNIYFAILGPGGAPAFGPVNLTKNYAWRSQSNPNAPKFKDPHIVASVDNHFLIAWLEDRIEQDLNKLSYAVYTTAGSVVKSPAVLTQSASGNLIHDPALTQAGQQILLAYSIEVNDAYPISYALLNSSGVVVKNPAELVGSNGLGLDATQFSTGNLLLAWTNPSSGRISYLVLDPNGTNIVAGPHEFELVGYRLPDYVSATVDEFGHAVLTWLDSQWNDYLYYAAVNGDGAVATPPMIYTVGRSADPLLDTSTEGLGNAPYAGASSAGMVFLPLTTR